MLDGFPSTLFVQPVTLRGMAGELKDRAKEARLMAGYRTVPPFARALNIESAAVYQIESGKTRSLKGGTLTAYARVTGCNAEWLASGKGPRTGNVTPITYAPRAAAERSGVGEPSQSVQLDLLTMAIQEVEGVLEAQSLELMVQKRAAVIASTYALLEKGLPSATVVHFIRAAVA
jgi:transcriptional regulator with XRE-family HTH domain